MKKLILLLTIFLLCGEASSRLYAGKRDIIAWALGTAHLTGGGVYYYNKNKKTSGFQETNLSKGYIAGVTMGAVPALNGATLLIIYAKWLVDDEYSPKEKAWKHGVYAGCSSYITIASAYMLFDALKDALKKVKV